MGTGNLKIRIKLHSNQWKIWSDSARFRVLVAGRRFGKTTLAINELFQNALKNSNSLNWYLAPTYRQAKMIAWKMLVNLIPTELVIKKYEVELRIILNNGSEICLKGCDNEESLKGVGISFVVLDEYAQMQANVWYEIIRPMLTDTLGRALFIGTPKGKNSLFELFIKGQQLIDGFKSWRFGTKDNPFIDQNEIKSAKQELPDRYFKQEYEASFEDYVGIVYPEFNPSHIIEPIYLQNIYPRIGTIDPAMSGTTAALKAAVDEDGNLFIYSEFYQQNKRVSDVTEIIKEENVRWWIDPASSEHLIQKEGKLYSLFNEYADNGIRAAPAENDVSAGINRVGEYFKTNKIKIFSTCKNLIYELERYHWSEEKETIAGVLKPKPYKKNDHLADCLRYLIMSHLGPADLNIKENLSYVSPLYKKNFFLYLNLPVLNAT